MENVYLFERGNIENLELRQLQYFVNVAKKQHMTKAAKELHVAQSAISRQIHLLEEELGIQLFMQKGRNLHLTSVGKLFMDRVEQVLDDLEKAVREVHEFLDPESGEIRIGFPHSVVLQLLPAVVSQFKKNHPNVKFRLHQGTYNSLIRDITNGEIDLAFISPFPHSHEHVTGETLLIEDLLAIVPQHHRLANHKSIQLDQLQDDPFVMYNEAYSLRTIVMQACQQAGFTPKIEFEADETDTIRGLVAAGVGVSLLPEMALLESSGIQPAKVRISNPKVSRSVGLIRRKSNDIPLVAELFRKFLLNYFEIK
jgi:LysR family transcriptional activator of glutamate synthase operon